MVEILDIQQKRKSYPIAIAGLDDFSCIPAGQAEPEILLQNPNISLYCLDDARQRAIFVETPPEINIAEHPFLYQAQYEHARRLFAVTYETLGQVVSGIPANNTPLVLIHSIGRSGSTLISKAFQEIDTITSLSEPDVYTQIVDLRTSGGERDDELTELVRSATKMLFKPSFTRGSAMWVIKFRSFCIQIADLLVAAFPDARSLFLYRNIDKWIISNARAFIPLFADTPPEQMREVVASLAPLVPLLAVRLQESTAEVTWIEFLTLMWLSNVHRYVRMHRAGIPMLAIRYEDMVARPTQTLRTVFAYLGVRDDTVDAAVQAFNKDSQEGSIISRDAVSSQGAIGIDEQQWDQVRDVLRRYPFSPEDVFDLPHVPASITV